MMNLMKMSGRKFVKLEANSFLSSYNEHAHPSHFPAEDSSVKWQRISEKEIQRLKVKIVDGQLQADVTKYQIGGRMAKGKYGAVSLLRPEGKGKTKAIKRFKDRYFTNRRENIKEFEIMHLWPNGAVGLILHPKGFISGQSVKDEVLIMHSYDYSMSIAIYFLSLQQRVEAVCQIIQGLITLHNLGIVHRDLHDGNVLYDKRKNRFDISDFGGARTKNELGDEFEKEVNQKDIPDLVALIKFILFRDREAEDVETIQDMGFSRQVSEMIYTILFASKNLKVEEILERFKTILSA